MTKVKICGITSLSDINLINLYMPDYVGFVFAESKRKITINNFELLFENLNKKIVPVGVLVNDTIENIEKYLCAGIKVIQLHGDEDISYIKNVLSFKSYFDFEIWKAIRIGNQSEKEIINVMKNFSGVERFVLDKHSNIKYGGLGESFSWKMYENLSNYFSII